MSTDAPTRPRKNAGRFKGEGFPEPDDDLEAAGSEYLKAVKKEGDAKGTKKQKLENLLDVMRSKGVSEYRIMFGSVEKLVRLDTKDSIKIETVRKTTDEDSSAE